MNKNSLKWHLVEGSVTYDFIIHLRVRDHTTRCWRYVVTALGHFLLGSHNFMVMALGSSCVKWPLVDLSEFHTSGYKVLGVLGSGNSEQYCAKATNECPGRLLGIIHPIPSVSESNRLHVVVVSQFFHS
jgi:hypothetical protein